jgi:hypothetical protein
MTAVPTHGTQLGELMKKIGGNAIEAIVEDGLAKEMRAGLELAGRQDRARGSWPSPRGVPMPEAPWPTTHDAMLKYLLLKARDCITAGMGENEAMLQLAVHAWYEGGIANYDRGQRDARRDR